MYRMLTERRIKGYFKRGAAGLISLLMVLAGGALASSPRLRNIVTNNQPGLYSVVYVDDGDTIVVKMPSGQETVRLIGADTPEVKDPRKQVQCFGEVASVHTKALLVGKKVRLAADPADSDRDKYHRLLRYVYLPDGTLLNKELITDGYAFAYVVFPFTKLDEFRQAETQARQAARGLWAGCNIDASSLIKQTAGAK